MNILYLTPFYPPNIGGAETFAESLVKETIKCHNVTVLTFQPFTSNKKTSYELTKKCGNSLEVYRLRWWLKQSHAWQGVSLKNALSVIPQMGLKSFSLLLTNHFDVIHAHGLLSGFVAVLLKKIFKIKTHITLLALYTFKDKSFMFKSISKFILKNADIVFVEGENGQRDLRGLGFDIKVKQFHHWCDQEVFKPPVQRSSDKVVVLFVGRPTYEKGKHIIEQAEHQMKHMGLNKFEFIYAENISYQELPSIYQMAHIVVVPSLYPEGYSRVVIEAASSGCAIITSNNGSLPEMVSVFGRYVNPEPLEFAEAINDCSGLLLKGMQLCSRVHAEHNFSSKNAEVFLNEYH